MSLALFANLACLWEATARKPGNVSRYSDFDDLTYLDFVVSAAASAPILGAAPGRPVGETVLRAVQATRQVSRTNANLGIILLLAPLAAVPEDQPLFAGVERVLDELTIADTRAVFAAIRLANPGGLGETPEQDVHSEPTWPLRQVMALAQDRDLIARQYGNGFRAVLEGTGTLGACLEREPTLEEAIVRLHLALLAEHLDSLIARKCGMEVAREASIHARQVLHGNLTRAEFDAWLRADGHRRNPGTTADLVAACLFAALRERMIPLPPPWPWS